MITTSTVRTMTTRTGHKYVVVTQDGETHEVNGVVKLERDKDDRSIVMLDGDDNPVAEFRAYLSYKRA